MISGVRSRRVYRQTMSLRCDRCTGTKGLHVVQGVLRRQMKSRIVLLISVFAGVFAGAFAVAGCSSYGTPTSTTPTLGTPAAPYSATDLVVGGGATATQGRTVTVSYNGWLYDPTKTDAK